MTRWTASDIPLQAGKLAVVTGPGGLGYETALELTRAGASVILVGRNRQTGQASVDRIRALVPGGTIRFGQVDLASLASVRGFAEALVADGAPIDILVNNAGVMMPPKRQLTADGFELQFGTNYLGHFALTAQLLPLLQRGRARVVSVSSIAANTGAIRFDDLSWAQGYRPDPSYAQSKLAMILFARELQRRSDASGWGLTSIGAHPGVAATDLITKGPGPTSLYGIVSTQCRSCGSRRHAGRCRSSTRRRRRAPRVVHTTAPTGSRKCAAIRLRSRDHRNRAIWLSRGGSGMSPGSSRGRRFRHR